MGGFHHNEKGIIYIPPRCIQRNHPIRDSRRKKKSIKVETSRKKKAQKRTKVEEEDKEVFPP
jgi:hypothetical protein